MSQTMLVLLGALGAELLLLLIVLLAVAFFRNRAASRRDQRAMRALIARVKKGKAEREQLLEQYLAERMGLSDPALTQAKVAMLRAELTLLQRFAGVYRNREAAMAARFDADLYAVLEPYHALAVGTQADQEPSQPGEVDETEIEALRQENERLSEELRITMETMSRMLNEYSTMFSGSAPENLQETEEPNVVPAPMSVDDVPFDTADQADEVPVDEFDTADDVDEVADAPDAGEFEAVAAEEEDLFAGDDSADIPEQESEADEADAELDPMAQVLRDAALQEQSARDAGDAVEVSVKTRPAGSAEGKGLDEVESTHADADADADADAGDVEIALEDGAPEELAATDPEGLDDLFDAGDDSLKAGSGR